MDLGGTPFILKAEHRISIHNLIISKAVTAKFEGSIVVQLRKWSNATPGWAIVGMSVCVSNFQAAPTGMSTLSRSATDPMLHCSEIWSLPRMLSKQPPHVIIH